MMSNTMMAILLIVYVIVLAVLAWSNRKLSKLARQAVEMSGDVIENASALIDLNVAWQKRDKAVAKLFGDVLFDLCHATDKNVLEWKLSMLRNIHFLMGLTGYENVYNDNFYTWMVNSLTQLPKNAQTEQLVKLAEAVKGYYIMDPDVGKNFIAMIADIINMNEDIDEAAESYKKTYKALLYAIQHTDLDLLVAETYKAPGGDLRTNLFESLQNLKDICYEAERVVAECDAAAKEADTHVETKQDPVDGEESAEPNPEEKVDEDGIPAETDPVVQGEESKGPEENAQAPRAEIPHVELTDGEARTGVEVIMGKKHI